MTTNTILAALPVLARTPAVRLFEKCNGAAFAVDIGTEYAAFFNLDTMGERDANGELVVFPVARNFAQDGALGEVAGIAVFAELRTVRFDHDNR